MLLILFFLYPLFSSVMAHIKLKSPEPRQPTYDTEPSKTFCGTYSEKTPSVTFTAGSSINVELSTGAEHGGGGCAFSLSYDKGKTFTVIQITDEKCPIVKNYAVTIPQNAPSCEHCIFAWSWVPVMSGQPEHYMSCVDIKIQGTGSGSGISGVQLQPVNMVGGTTWHQAKTAPWVNEKSFFGNMAGGGSYNGQAVTRPSIPSQKKCSASL